MSGEGQDPFVSDHPARLFEEHVGGVLALTRAILHDNALAEDAAQEAFVRALAARTTFDPERGTFRTWLLSIARHVAFEVLAKRKKSPGVASEATEGADDASLFDLGLAAGWGRESPEAELARAEQHAVLARALASLSPGDRELIVLRDLEGLDAEMIAKLAEGGINTRDELADLAVDELVDITGQSEEEAKILILKAREHWFTGQA